MNEQYLPPGLEHMKIEKKYWKTSQFKEGETKIRVVKRPIAGWIDWQENKPKRYRPDQKPRVSFDPDKPMKPFWSCYVWDYERKDLFILEINQRTILKSLETIVKDEDWGDLTQFDLKIKKEGAGKETKYHVSPIPHKPVNDEISNALKTAPVRLEALYEGKDPWEDIDEAEDDIKAVPNDLPSLVKILVDNIQMEATESGKLLDYLKFAQPKLPKPIDECLDAWLANPDQFMKAYRKWLQGQKASA